MANIEALRALGNGQHSNTDTDDEQLARKLRAPAAQPSIVQLSVIKPSQQRQNAEPWEQRPTAIGPAQPIRPAQPPASFASNVTHGGGDVGSKGAAKQYLDTIAPELASRAGAKIADATDWAVAREVVAFAQGAMSGGRGLIQLFSEDALPDNALDFAAQELMLRNKDDKLATWFMEAAQSGGNMLPGIAAGFVNPVLGQAIFGASAAGSAYREYKQAGLDTDNAAVGGVLRGLSEVFTQTLLGGLKIPGFSGIFTGKVADALGKHVGSAIGKVAVEYGVDILSEVIEENAQNFIEPAINLMIGAADKYEAPGWDEFVDTTMSTLFMTAAFNSANAKINNSVDRMKSNMEFTKDYVKPGCEEILESSYANSAIYELAENTLAQIKSGEVIDSVEFEAQMRTALAKDAEKFKANAAPVARLATPQEQAEARAELVQENNPDATVIQSATEQEYINTGAFTAEQRTAASEVLDGIVSGEITKLDAQQVAALKLDTEAGAAVASKVLGIEIAKQKVATNAQKRAVGASIMQRYNTTQAEVKAQAARDADMRNVKADAPLRNSIGTASRDEIAASAGDTAADAVCTGTVCHSLSCASAGESSAATGTDGRSTRYPRYSPRRFNRNFWKGK